MPISEGEGTVARVAPVVVGPVPGAPVTPVRKERALAPLCKTDLASQGEGRAGERGERNTGVLAGLIHPREEGVQVHVLQGELATGGDGDGLQADGLGAKAHVLGPESA